MIDADIESGSIARGKVFVLVLSQWIIKEEARTELKIPFLIQAREVLRFDRMLPANGKDSGNVSRKPCVSLATSLCIDFWPPPSLTDQSELPRSNPGG